MGKPKEATPRNIPEGISLASLAEDMKKLREQNNSMALRIESLEGRNLKLENKISDLTTQLEDITLRCMQKNLIFHGIEEKRNEDTKKIVLNIITKNMKIEEKFVKSQQHLDGLIEIDITHRLGTYQQGRNRPIIASFTSKSAVDLIKRNAKNLAGTNVRVSEQLPREMRARRAAQIPKMLELRQQKPNAATILKQDKLFQDGQEVKNSFSKNSLRIMPGTHATDVSKLFHSDIRTVKGSKFQSHGMRVTTLKDAQSAIAGLYQKAEVAVATHIIYAYRIKDGQSGILVEGHDDDGEWSAGSAISSLLEEKGAENIIIAVSRKYGGTDLGKQRFAIIKELADKALEELA